MIYRSSLVAMAFAIAAFLASCFSTKLHEKAAWLSNDKVTGSVQRLNSLSIVSLCSTADNPLYLAITAVLQQRLHAAGISNGLYFLPDTESRESARNKVLNDLRDFVLYLLPVRGVTSYDEMNNPMLLKQMEFVVESRTGEKTLAGLISIDRETTSNKLAGTIAGIIFDYLKTKGMVAR